MELGLSGKVAIVGGGSGGIGSAVATALAREGARVVIWSRRDPALSNAAERIRGETGAEVLPVLGDQRVAADQEKIVSQAIEKFGRVDILVNNGGAPPLGQLMKFDDEAWDKAVRQMLLSVVRLARLCQPSMKASGGGRIINVAALSAKAPLAGFGLTAATLAGLIGFSKTLSRELGADRITVNTICPGRIDTDLTKRALKAQADMQKRTVEEVTAEATARIPLRRFGRPEEIGAVVAFLASSQAAFITGTTIQVDGGAVEALM